MDDTQFSELVGAGLKLERDRIRLGYNQKPPASLTTDSLKNAHEAIAEVDLDPVLERYHEAIRRIRSEGIDVSDRRAIKLLKLVAAAALMRRSMEANLCDFRVLYHVWNTPEQIPHLQAIVDPYLEGCDVQDWSTERDLKEIEADIKRLAGQVRELSTDADYKDFLQQSQRLRLELDHHSETVAATKLRKRLDKPIDEAMNILDSLE